jgi:thiol-disulfide isomerase/thioredoxin
MSTCLTAALVAWAGLCGNASAQTKPAASGQKSEPIASAKSIDFTDSLEMAKTLTADAPKPIVIQFGATWCGWCRKLEKETLTDAAVLAVAGRFVWVHADVDKEPELAARFGARALPHAVVIDDMGRVLAESTGFSDGKAYAAFLARGEAGFVPIALSKSGAALDPAAIPERAKVLIETMAPASATGRDQCVEALRRLGPSAFEVLVDLLGSERLGVRAAAGYALGELASADIGFDPLSAREERGARIARWKAWLASDQAKTLRPSPPAAKPSSDVEPAKPNSREPEVKPARSDKVA